MQAVFLDAASVGSVDMTPLVDLIPQLKFYEYTKVNEISKRLLNQKIAILNKTPLDAETLKQSKLKLICITATGTDNVDCEQARKLKIEVRNVAGYSTNSVNQVTFALILALKTQLIAYSELIRSCSWQRSRLHTMLNYPFDELSGKTLGIIGYGTIGQRVAEIAKVFNMDILIAERPNQPVRQGRCEFTQVLQQADILTLHCPLTPETQNLINTKTLGLMKPSAFIINTARGGLIDSQALANALKTKQISGAGIDVLPEEPPIHGDPLLDLKHPRLLITPHIAWAAKEARQRVIDLTAENIRSYLARKTKTA